MNWKQALRAGIFILLFILMTTGLTYILRTNGDVKDRFTGFYSEQGDSIDVIAIGSSPVYPCIATPMLYHMTGTRLYPLSTNMQRPVAAPFLIREARKTQNPQLFIIEVRMFAAADEDLKSNMAHTRGVTDNLRYSMNRIKTIMAMVGPEDDPLSYYLDIFKYHSNWKTLVLKEQLRDVFYIWPDDLKGYVTYDSVGPCEPADLSGITDREPIPEEQEEALLKVCDELKAGGEKGLFLLLPYAMEEKNVSRFNYIRDLVTQNGYDYLDMNSVVDEIGLDYELDFNDYGNHTNALGAAKVTAWLGSWLKEHYDLPDHRGEGSDRDAIASLLWGGGNSWDKAYEQYSSEYAKAAVTIRERYAAQEFYVAEEEE
ncbi:MAG: SGNH/GDSL hydrolase family protein [Lachnospiraceae bacterium]|nr:SGNH/GDSL hydrolase family protein [Lachnospiraceae bacterium]